MKIKQDRTHLSHLLLRHNQSHLAYRFWLIQVGSNFHQVSSHLVVNGMDQP
jgi:hypothetical protein